MQCIQMEFDDHSDGFFFKPAHYPYDVMSANAEHKTFTMRHNYDFSRLHASLGPFDVYQAVPNVFGDEALVGRLTNFSEHISSHKQRISNMVISAQMVSDKVFLSDPLLQVLIHVGPAVRQMKVSDYGFHGDEQHWCVQVIVQHSAEKLFSWCVIENDDSACVAGIYLDTLWWQQNSSQVSVYYDVSFVRDSKECVGASNIMVSKKFRSNMVKHHLHFISNVPLLNLDLPFREEFDNDLIFRIPTQTFFPGSRFEIQVLLQPYSKLQVFVVRISVHHGLEIIDVLHRDDSPWNIYYGINNTDHSASLTAYVEESFEHTRSIRIEIMNWDFAVRSVDVDSVGRIMWTVEYPKKGQMPDPYDSGPPSHLFATVNIVAYQPKQLVAVFKEIYLLNTAIFTGVKQVYRLHVFAVSSNNGVREVTQQADCISTDRGALKVLRNCTHVFLDGTETHGSEDVSIVVRFRAITTHVPVLVWFPDRRVHVQLSDTKLSHINGWRVLSAPLKRNRTALPGWSLSGTDHTDCELRMQQSIVEVLSRFVIHTATGRHYFMGRKVFMHVTPIIRDRLRTLNSTVATIRGQVVHGHSTGKTEILVLSATNHVLGTRTIRVGRGVVKVSGLVVRVVSGLSLRISRHQSVEGALSATVAIRDRLSAPQQVAVLDIAVQYDDGNEMPLHHINPGLYDLSVHSLNSSVIHIPPYVSSTKLPVIQAHGSGSGEVVEVGLYQRGIHCPSLRHPLAVKYVSVQVDLRQEPNALGYIQSDSSHDNNPSGESWLPEEQKLDAGNKLNYRAKHINRTFTKKETYFQAHNNIPHSSVFRHPQVVSGPDDTLLIEARDIANVDYMPHTEALLQVADSRFASRRFSATGVYLMVALISILSLSVSVFLFLYCRRKYSAKYKLMSHGSTYDANDWVWIGSKALQGSPTLNVGCLNGSSRDRDTDGRLTQLSTDDSGFVSLFRSDHSSTVSTYEGSKCSMTVRSNPLEDNMDVGSYEAEWDYKKLGLTYDQLAAYFDGLEESFA